MSANGTLRYQMQSVTSRLSFAVVQLHEGRRARNELQSAKQKLRSHWKTEKLKKIVACYDDANDHLPLQPSAVADFVTLVGDPVIANGRLTVHVMDALELEVPRIVEQAPHKGSPADRRVFHQTSLHLARNLHSSDRNPFQTGQCEMKTCTNAQHCLLLAASDAVDDSRHRFPLY
jgi:hypothetical protein